MYIEISKKITKSKVYEYILLRTSTRDKKSGKIVKKTIANLTNEPVEKVMALINAFKGNQNVSPDDLKQGRTIGFSLVIIFIMRLLGMISLLGKTFEAKIAILLIVARITLQSSRLQALYWAKNEDKILDILKFSDSEKNSLNNKSIYLGLDYLYERQSQIEEKLFKAYYKDNPPKMLFYDVTSSYVEGDYSDSELVAYGYNRDKKQGKAQVVIGLLTDENGYAISIQAYRGNTNDIQTFKEQLDKLKNRFKLENITIVGDGGLIKSEDIAKIKEFGYDYITSISKSSIKKLINDDNSNVEMSLFDEKLKEVIESDSRYILRCNPIRRDEIRETRDSKIKRLKEFVEDKTNYYNTHYRAKKETLIKDIDKKISDLKLTKFVSILINYKDGDCKIEDKDKNVVIKTKSLVKIEISIDEKVKSEIEKLDGCYAIKTSLTDKKDTKEDIHKSYKNLINVENAFKTLKTDYLEIRPLYLKTDKRIKGHIFLSMLSYNIVLKLKEYTKLCNLDFKSTINSLKGVSTTLVQMTKKLSVNYIPEVNKNLKSLFNTMGFTMPKKVDY